MCVFVHKLFRVHVFVCLHVHVLQDLYISARFIVLMYVHLSVCLSATFKKKIVYPLTIYNYNYMY